MNWPINIPIRIIPLSRPSQNALTFALLIFLMGVIFGVISWGQEYRYRYLMARDKWHQVTIDFKGVACIDPQTGKRNGRATNMSTTIKAVEEMIKP